MTPEAAVTVAPPTERSRSATSGQTRARSSGSDLPLADRLLALAAVVRPPGPAGNDHQRDSHRRQADHAADHGLAARRGHEVARRPLRAGPLGQLVQVAGQLQAGPPDLLLDLLGVALGHGRSPSRSSVGTERSLSGSAPRP